MLLAAAGVHHHLIRAGSRIRTSIVADSAEPREVHHAAALLGYGADALCPYGALATIRDLAARGRLGDAGPDAATDRYVKALKKGVLKVMSKMGISTLQSYRGAQIFEIVGLDDEVVDAFFTGTVSRLGGVGLDTVEDRVRTQHRHAYPAGPGGDGAAGTATDPEAALDVGGRYQWRTEGERHALSPSSIASLQHATRGDEPREQKYREYAEEVNQYNRDHGTLRGLLRVLGANGRSLSVEEVEPWTEIVKRFKTGAMSYGSIGEETHTTLARAMNELGGKSNTGEGGEHPDRYPDDHPARSRIKQIASGRFGVTLPYLDAADEIQIKMAQGAKPGEGGQLPGEKVYPWIAEVRHSTPGVPLISPPPHHDIYSIEDLAQLIFDLKNANPDARVSVKLVSAAGVGTIAAGVAKAKADHILISGHSGGTGASPQGSIMHAGLPWELGIADAHQMLVKQGLRRRVTLEADGGLRTGRDVAIAALLGAQEFGFSTAPLVSLGCIMMRKCHLNTCPVGIATQDPELREKFDGEPEHVVNFFYLVAQEVRRIMAGLGMESLEEMVGRVDRLQPAVEASERGLDLSTLLQRPTTPAGLREYAEQTEQDHELDPDRNDVLDHDLIDRAAPALDGGEPVTLDVDITNRDRTVGTLLSREVIRRHGRDGLPDGTVTLRCRGTAGQSFAAFAAPGITFDVRGQANDYLGKGLSGAHLVLQPPEDAAYAAEDAIVAGNVALYGATSGRLFLRGRAGERFAVRNSGAEAVVEGVGDHGCEYMTGGCVVVLGPTGRNFAAGMSGGVAYVHDPDGTFAAQKCNRDMVELDPVAPGTDDARRLRALVDQHHAATDSPVAARFLNAWPDVLGEVVKVIATAYKEAIEDEETAAATV
jgi:glutamate synthase domain-containing protein 2/glutamate synthase domain-containing protein 3